MLALFYNLIGLKHYVCNILYFCFDHNSDTLIRDTFTNFVSRIKQHSYQIQSLSYFKEDIFQCETNVFLSSLVQILSSDYMK